MQIGSKEGVIVPDLVVHSGRVEILGNNLQAGEGENSPIRIDRCSIRVGIQRKQRDSVRVCGRGPSGIRQNLCRRRIPFAWRSPFVISK